MLPLTKHNRKVSITMSHYTTKRCYCPHQIVTKVRAVDLIQRHIQSKKLSGLKTIIEEIPIFLFVSSTENYDEKRHIHDIQDHCIVCLSVLAIEKRLKEVIVVTKKDFIIILNSIHMRICRYK